MPLCDGCDGEFDAEALVRHEHDGFVLVHCPDCGRSMGSYNTHVHHGRR